METGRGGTGNTVVYSEYNPLNVDGVMCLDYGGENKLSNPLETSTTVSERSHQFVGNEACARLSNSAL